ncbi:O-antigen ligase family protein [Brassicibacter mesophilus]|uniref:O-antigen ligase family protein n=1 Tax=Brassicibacter mesophilus TaxID=745119 RepID=UPI003D2298D9
MSSKTATLKQGTILTTENIIFTGLCILLFLAPFFRGLYFDPELLPAHIFSFTLALVWMIYKYKDKSYKLIKTPIDILAIGVVFMYFISIFYGVNTRLAIGEFLKYANYFVIFLLARDLATDERRKRWLLNTIILSGVGVCLVGIGSAIGTWSYNGAIVSGRINSTFQYPNTLASYLGALFVLSIGLVVSEERKLIKALYSACSSIMLFTFILTYSRGMWLILPFILLLFIIFIPNKRKLEAIINLIINGGISIPLAFLFSQKLEGGSTILWMIVIFSAIATGVLTYALSMIQNRLRNVSIKKLMIAFSIIFILCGVFVAYAINSTISLTLANTSTENKWTSVYRNIEKILPNIEYELIVKYNGENNNEKLSVGRIRIYSVDAEGKLEKIEFVDITDPHTNELNIPFTSLDSTEAVRVNFDNYYTDTSITYSEASIINKNTNEIVKDIPLKYKYIPESIVKRFESISLENHSAQARIAFYRDSFKVIKDYPILGTGGGGWVTLYQMYQSYLYWTKLAHNYFLQMWVEVGIIGLGIFVSLVLGLVYIAYKKYRNIENEDERTVLVSVVVAVAAILGHAFMDFDLSLSALTFILWMLMGVLYSGFSIVRDIDTSNSKNKKIKQNSNICNVVVSLIMLILIIGSSSLLLANKNAEKALAASKKQKIDEAINYFEKASKFDKYNAEYKTDLSTFYKVKFQLTQDKEYVKKSLELTEKAIRLAPYSSQLNSIASSVYMSIGKIDDALELVEKAIELQPMRTQNYVQKCDAYLAAFNYYAAQKKDLNKAEEIIEEAYKVKEEIKAVNDIALKPLKYNEDLVYKIGFIQFNYENLKNREYKLEKGYALDFAYYFDLDIDSNEKIDKLRIWNSKEGNIQYELINEEEDSYIRITNDGESYGLVYPSGLKLEPDTEYNVYFKVRGNVKDTTFNFYVYDGKAENEVQGVLKCVKLNDDWQIYKLNIKTDSDIESGTQYLRLQHNGKDLGYIDIEETVIFKKIK